MREILNRFPDLGDVILRAFIARRHRLQEPGNFTGVRVIGSRYSRDTLRIRDFLSKNRVPFTWLDLEIDPQVGQLTAPADGGRRRSAGRGFPDARWRILFQVSAAV